MQVAIFPSCLTANKEEINLRQTTLRILVASLFMTPIWIGHSVVLAAPMSGHDYFSECARIGGVHQVSEDLVFEETDRIYFDKETEIDGNGFGLTSSILTDQGFLYVTGEDSGHPGANGRLFIKNFGKVEGFTPGSDVDENLIFSDSGIRGFGHSLLTVGNYGYLSVESSVIQNNRNDDGSTFSGVFQLEKWGSLRLKNSIVYNNRGNVAGVIATVAYRTLEPGDVEILESSFLKNEATECAGAIYVERASSLYVLGSYFRENKALWEEGGGGAIYATNETYTIVNSSTFEDNFFCESRRSYICRRLRDIDCSR